MVSTLDSNKIFQPIGQLLGRKPPPQITLQRPFAPQPLSPLAPPAQLFGGDQLSLNIKGYAKSSAIEVLQKQASASSINRVIDRATGTRNTYNNRVEILVDGREVFGKMKEYIRSAKETLYFEMFIMHEDGTGWEIARELAQKRQQGVDVKVILDGIGYGMAEKGRIKDYLLSQGIEVQIYNKQLVEWDKMNVTHRKLVLVDGYKGMTGGMNVGDEYHHEWHDLMMTVEGEAVQEMQQEFFYNWQKAGGTMPAYIPGLPPGQQFGHSAARITVTSPDEAGKEKDTKNAMISAINSALHHIYVEQPYFSDEDFVQSLIAAAKRKIKVEVFLPAISDDPIHAVVNKRNAERVVQAGGQVYFIDAGRDGKRFTHGKIMTIDGVWTTVGSTNTDSRALGINQELNVSITDARFAETIEKRVFDWDRRSSVPFKELRFPLLSRLKAQFFSFFNSLL